MTEVAFLAYVPDPFAMVGSCFMVRLPNAGDQVLTGSELSAFDGPLLTLDLSGLVDDLRRLGCAPPSALLDFGEAIRLGVGLSKDDGGEKHWDIWPVLTQHFASVQDAHVYRLLVLARIERPEASELARLLSAALCALESAWASVAEHLRRLNEIDRLVDVEWPLQSLFAYRQYHGIRVDAERTYALFEAISAEKYQAYRIVAEILGRSPTGLSFRTIGPNLRGTDLSHLVDVDPARMQDAFELAASASPLAAAFVTLVKASRDEAIVQRALGGEERLYPVFNVLGTISGRVLVSDPYLQQLRRHYRGLIAADPHRRLVYLDYAQFEPGILAGLSDDSALISAYNRGDLYLALAEILFRDVKKRPLAKRVFLAFSYGMTADRIALMLAGKDASEKVRGELAGLISTFFASFPGLEQFRAAQCAALQRDGMVSSLFGNRRVRQTGGPLTHKERRWALNQPVQATASLIFKEALVRLKARFGAEAILLPMHDAALIQLADSKSFESEVDEASQIMIDSFKARFPKIVARVTSGAFSGDV
ncbi:DNA polymerase [Zavarzinia sp. CC-PAN008]|uniref:DNA polymerase n=1 Tax=Zavarzinia sp. CC-PAN008 TaxID=3243332 RepID=UPI003F749235